MDTAQHPPMNGDDDLAKTLDAGLQFEETPVGSAKPGEDPAMAPTLGPLPDPASLGLTAPSDTKEEDEDKEDSKKDDTPAIHHGHGKAAHEDSAKSGNSDLEKLKSSALEELRPLVSKLDLPAEEKFDTLLLIIRTTDDQALLEEAHAAAKNIGDDKRRAQALLDIIKEIDYFSAKRDS